MGNLDDHDPSLSDDFARDHEVILFNDTGVASTNGTAPCERCWVDGCPIDEAQRYRIHGAGNDHPRCRQ
jgi:hypothetical protein